MGSGQSLRVSGPQNRQNRAHTDSPRQSNLSPNMMPLVHARSRVDSNISARLQSIRMRNIANRVISCSHCHLRFRPVSFWVFESRSIFCSCLRCQQVLSVSPGQLHGSDVNTGELMSNPSLRATHDASRMRRAMQRRLRYVLQLLLYQRVLENQRFSIMNAAVHRVQNAKFVEELPVRDISPEEVHPDNKCPICHDPFSCKGEDAVELPECRHIFHKACIGKWISAKHKSCPVCRIEIC